jgi:hypothetical protein
VTEFVTVLMVDDSVSGGGRSLDLELGRPFGMVTERAFTMTFL